ESARRASRTTRQYQSAPAAGPAHQPEAVPRYPGLLQQPLLGGRDVLDPFAAAVHLALLDAALRAKLARSVTIRPQHRMAGFHQMLGPVAIARQHLFGMAAQPAATVQRDDSRKWPVAVRLVKLRVQRPVGIRDLDLLWLGQSRGTRGQDRGE